MNSVNYYSIPGFKRDKKDPFKITPELIISTVCEHVGQPEYKVLGRQRFQTLIVPKYIIILFLYTYTSMNKSAIARKCGLDHTTVIKALRTFPHRVKNEETISQSVKELKEKLLITNLS
jgi:chromosomal replication initiation ATPase DnaA